MMPSMTRLRNVDVIKAAVIGGAQATAVASGEFITLQLGQATESSQDVICLLFLPL